MDRKGGLQLSINFLVVIILSIVLFGIGLTIFYQVIEIGAKVQLDIDEQTQAQLDRALDDGGIVIIPRKVVEVTGGEVAYITFGFINEGEIATFSLDVESDDTEHFPQNAQTLVYYKNYDDVGMNQRVYGRIGIVANKNVPVGQYGFSIDIKKETAPYGGHHKAYVYVT